jgi:hypothetical protein
MKYRFSLHAEWELERRQIPAAWLDSVLNTPEQRIQSSAETEIRQSRFATQDGRIYLLRAVVAVDRDPPVVVTVYRTSKVQKYWRTE